MSTTEKWSKAQTYIATTIIAFFHIFSTVLIGLCVGFLGYKISIFYKSYAIAVAALILVIIGLYYLFSEVFHKLSHHHHIFEHKHHHHNHEHDHDEHCVCSTDENDSSKRYNALIASLALSSFLTPCIELEAYYFSAGLFGWQGILFVSAIYVVVTILLTILLVYFGLKGREKLKFHFVEKYEHQIVGIIMIIIGLSIYFLE
jgi:putative Mn2+ efflux pump MntP